MNNKCAAVGLVILGFGTIVNFIASAIGFGYFFAANTHLSFLTGVLIWILFNILFCLLGWYFIVQDSEDMPPMA
jgi:hypothetical protein